MLAGELARFANDRGLAFDERALLEHLLLKADHRSAALEPFSLSELARDLGLGPSGRRTLRNRIERLQSAGAVDWTPAVKGRPGRLVVTAYSVLVHRGSDDDRRGFVQLVPAALRAHVRRHRLSPTAAALLVRLSLEADCRTHRVAVATPRALGGLLGLGATRLETALAELAAAGMLLWPPEQRLQLLAYFEVVRTAPSGDGGPEAARPGPGRAASPTERAPHLDRTRAPQVSSRVRDPDLGFKTPPPTPPKDPHAAPIAGGRGRELIAKISTQLTEDQVQALHRPEERPILGELTSRLERLEAGGWTESELVSHLGAPFPKAWRSAAGLLRGRARKLPDSPPDTETLRASAAAERAEAELERGRAHARTLAASEADTAEAVEVLMRRFEGDALEAGLETLARRRPGEDVAAASRALTGCVPSGGALQAEECRDPTGHRVPDGSELAGPTSLAELLGKLTGGRA